MPRVAAPERVELKFGAAEIACEADGKFFDDCLFVRPQVEECIRRAVSSKGTTSSLQWA